LGVERLDKLHDVSPFRKVFAIGYGGEVNRFIASLSRTMR